jgi:hypothetical protein
VGILADESGALDMSRRIQLPKELVIRCFALCRQAERSLDHALGAPWLEFVAYYSPPRLGALEDLVARLEDRLPQPASPGVLPSSDELFRGRTWQMLFHLLLGRWVQARKTAFGYREPVVRFILAQVRTLLAYLASKERPDQQELIALRMAMFDCQRLLETPCPWLPELRSASRVEHFLYPEHLVPVTLEELLKECPERVPLKDNR